MGGHAGAVAGEAQVLLGGGLDVDPVHVYAQSGGHVFLHLRAVGADLRGLGDKGGVDIHHPVSGAGQGIADPGQQGQTGDIQESIIAVREQLPDVSQGGGTQQRVHDGVGQHVGIGMTVQATVIGDGDAA